jgi:hypothetical protein
LIDGWKEGRKQCTMGTIKVRTDGVDEKEIELRNFIHY